MSDRNSCNGTRNQNAMRLNGNAQSAAYVVFISYPWMNSLLVRPQTSRHKWIFHFLCCRRNTNRLRFKYISTFYWPIDGSVWCAPHAANRETTTADQTNHTSRFNSHRHRMHWDLQCAPIVLISFVFRFIFYCGNEIRWNARVRLHFIGFVLLHEHRLFLLSSFDVINLWTSRTRIEIQMITFINYYCFSFMLNAAQSMSTTHALKLCRANAISSQQNK